MNLRDSAIEEMKDWLVAENTDLGFAVIKRTPTMPASSFPAIFIHEGDDRIVKTSTRHWHDYPVERVVEVIFEIWDYAEANTDIRTHYDNVRNVLLTNKLSNSCKLKELRAYGPFNGGAHGAIAMQLVMSLSYTDNGPAFQ